MTSIDRPLPMEANSTDADDRPRMVVVSAAEFLELVDAARAGDPTSPVEPPALPPAAPAPWMA
jgi:hypothetical protein